jgi:YidC/Oxa1 family membrane protein insertase
MFALPIANILADAVGPIVTVLDNVLRWLHNDIGLSWGLGIITLTVMVRILLIPLTYKQITSMIHMQQYQPQIKELNEKYKDDPQRKQQELMKFFKTHGINPLASCLPILFQLPFFMAMFYALGDDTLQSQIQATGPSFLFIDNLVVKATGAELAILLVLYVGSQLGSTVVSLSSATDETQRKIMIALPFLFVPVVIGFPAGLVLYWITTNFWTFGQSFIVKHLKARSADATTLAANVSDGEGGTVVSSGNGAVASEQVPKKAPPPPPRQKRKRSGRRR